jgi:HK97 gp10 family phage protein
MVTKATLDVKGLAKYLETIAQAGIDIDAAAQRGLMKGGAVLEAEMDALVPVGETGDLKAAVALDGPYQEGNFSYVEVGVIGASADVAEYGNVQEYGSPSKNIPAQPYIRPAIDGKRRAVMQEVRKSLKAEGLAD